MEPERLARLFQFENFKTSGLKPRGEGIRIDENTGVSNVNEPHEGAPQTVAADEDSSRLEDTPYFAKHFVLQIARGHMMQHGERDAP